MPRLCTVEHTCRQVHVISAPVTTELTQSASGCVWLNRNLAAVHRARCGRAVRGNMLQTSQPIHSYPAIVVQTAQSALFAANKVDQHIKQTEMC